MSVVLKINGSVTSVFKFKGERSDLWLKTVLRVLNNPKYRYDPRSRKNASAVVEVCSDCYSDTFWINGLGLRLLKARIKSAQLYMEIEKALEQIKEGKWSEIEYRFGYGNFRIGIRRIWSLAMQEGMLQFERRVFDVVSQNGGMSVETILARLLLSGCVCTFKQVREALEHLNILYVVEKQHGQYSVRCGMLEDA
jgi:hypothetical protein